MFTRHGKRFLSFLTGALALTSCESAEIVGSGEEQQGGAARLTVQITDAPGDLAEAWVKVNKIILVKGESGEGSGSDRVELTPRPITENGGYIDLLKLDNGRVQDLVTDTVRPGTYGQLRIVVCDMYIKTASGQIVASPDATLPAGVTRTAGAELRLTSQCRNGFKVNFANGGVTVAEGSSTVVIDFDVQRSFVHQAGRSGKWIVNPVLHGVRGGEGATISGTVTLNVANLPLSCGGESLNQNALRSKFVATATAGTTVRTGRANGQGSYRISNVAPGVYTLGTEQITFSNGDKLGFTATANPASVTVTAGGSATSNYTVTAASCIRG